MTGRTKSQAKRLASQSEPARMEHPEATVERARCIQILVLSGMDGASLTRLLARDVAQVAREVSRPEAHARAAVDPKEQELAAEVVDAPAKAAPNPAAPLGANRPKTVVRTRTPVDGAAVHVPDGKARRLR